MADYSGVKSAVPSAGGNYFSSGKHRVRISSVKELISQDPRKNKAALFVISCEIVSSTVHKAGEMKSQVINLNHQPALGNIKQFIYALGPTMGYPAAYLDQFEPAQIDTLIKNIVSMENPARGKILDVETYEIVT